MDRAKLSELMVLETLKEGVSLDPLEWLARLSDHIPEPRKHRTFFYDYYASRTRAAATRSEK